MNNIKEAADVLARIAVLGRQKRALREKSAAGWLDMLRSKLPAGAPGWVRENLPALVGAGGGAAVGGLGGLLAGGGEDEEGNHKNRLYSGLRGALIGGGLGGAGGLGYQLMSGAPAAAGGGSSGGSAAEAGRKAIPDGDYRYNPTPANPLPALAKGVGAFANDALLGVPGKMMRAVPFLDSANSAIGGSGTPTLQLLQNGKAPDVASDLAQDFRRHVDNTWADRIFHNTVPGGAIGQTTADVLNGAANWSPAIYPIRGVYELLRRSTQNQIRGLLGDGASGNAGVSPLVKDVHVKAMGDLLHNNAAHTTQQHAANVLHGINDERLLPEGVKSTGPMAAADRYAQAMRTAPPTLGQVGNKILSFFGVKPKTLNPGFENKMTDGGASQIAATRMPIGDEAARAEQMAQALHSESEKARVVGENAANADMAKAHADAAARVTNPNAPTEGLDKGLAKEIAKDVASKGQPGPSAQTVQEKLQKPNGPQPAPAPEPFDVTPATKLPPPIQPQVGALVQKAVRASLGSAADNHPALASPEAAVKWFAEQSPSTRKAILGHAGEHSETLGKVLNDGMAKHMQVEKVRGKGFFRDKLEAAKRVPFGFSRIPGEKGLAAGAKRLGSRAMWAAPILAWGGRAATNAITGNGMVDDENLREAYKNMMAEYAAKGQTPAGVTLGK